MKTKTKIKRFLVFVGAIAIALAFELVALPNMAWLLDPSALQNVEVSKYFRGDLTEYNGKVGNIVTAASFGFYLLLVYGVKRAIGDWDDNKQ